jgi:hypothetical protein
MLAPRMKLLTVVAAVGLVVGATAVVAGGAIPDGNMIHGCYKNDTGDLRVIDAGAGDSCKKNEPSLDWVQTGAQGVQGPQGATGAQGPAGAAGTDGVSGYEIETATGTTAYDSFWQMGAVTVDNPCPAGKASTGTGFDLPASPKVSVFREGLHLLVLGDTGATVTGYTICVDKQILGK